MSDAHVRRLATLPRAEILGTGVSASSFEEALSALAACVRSREPAVFSAANVYSVMLARSDPALSRAVNTASYVMADGMPLVWMARRLGYRAERVHGDDLLLAACVRHRRWRHFFLGGAPGQPDAVATALSHRFPGLIVAGARATPARPLPESETEAVIMTLKERDVDVIWVGMGTPSQDLWMAANRERVGRPMVGVGSAFNLLSGRTRPAPRWMKRSGLQWLHRLGQEPLRLGRRYLVYNSLFVWHAARIVLAGQRSGSGTDERST